MNSVLPLVTMEWWSSLDLCLLLHTHTHTMLVLLTAREMFLTRGLLPTGSWAQTSFQWFRLFLQVWTCLSVSWMSRSNPITHCPGITSHYTVANFNSLTSILTFINFHTALDTAGNYPFLEGSLTLGLGGSTQRVLFLHGAEAQRI